MPHTLTITLASGTAAERGMEASLHSLLETHDLDGYIFTGTVHIAEDAMPHSHPVLTLNTAWKDDSVMVLSEFLHEQLHWFEEERSAERDRFIAATRVPYPEVPVARPDGTGDETSTRLHLLVCHLEHRALASLIGADAARAAMERLSRHHYRWVYRTILADEAAIDRLVDAHGLTPPALSTARPG